MDLDAFLSDQRSVIDDALRTFFPDDGFAHKLHEACAWSLHGGGKRVRPVLVLAAFDAVGGTDRRAALPPACAVEMVHTYSLVHDDLPSMDDDAERRGRPTTHVQFNEALALLAGDALLTEAFAVVSNPAHYGGAVSAETVLRLTTELARAAGWRGMVGGQSIDLGFEASVDTEEALSFLHGRKTGELFRYALLAGALAGGADDRSAEQLARYGLLLGLAFQIADDVLDELQDQTERGDETADTPSYVALLGLEGARARARAVADEAVALLAELGEAAEPLRALARYTVTRDR